jgi:hypothetical protein
VYSFKMLRPETNSNNTTNPNSNTCCRNACFKIFSIILFLCYTAADVIFSNVANNQASSIGTIVPSIVTFLSADIQKVLQILFGIISALARGLTLVVICLVINRMLCKCGSNTTNNNIYNSNNSISNNNNNNSQRNDISNNKNGSYNPSNNNSKDKSIEMVRQNPVASIPNGDLMLSSTGDGVGNNIQYQPPAVRIHTVALEVSMQDDFERSMQARKRQTFGIGRDISYRHKPREGFELPKDTSNGAYYRVRNPITGGGGSGSPQPVSKHFVGSPSNGGTLRLPSMSVAEAIALGQSSKDSRFVQAHVVEQELNNLQQQIGEMKNFFETLATEVQHYGTKTGSHHGSIKAATHGTSELTAMVTGSNFRNYDQAKQEKRDHEEQNKSQQNKVLLKKRSMDLM